MRTAEIVIVGGGLAGSLAAAMLARRGYGVVLVDPHKDFPPDFRCEKIDGPQTELLRKTGLADAILAAAAPDKETWVAQLGHLVEKRQGDQFGILYGDLVNVMRSQIPATAEVVHGMVTGIETTPDRQTVTLSDGGTISARLVVLANGLNAGLRQSIGLEREVLSACHSVTIGFDVKPAVGNAFPFSSLTYYGERTDDKVAYLTLFPVRGGAGLRANFMVYRDIHDQLLEQFRAAPRETLASFLRGLERLTGPFEVTGHIKVRPADLYVTRGIERPGLVLVGDAYATSCPAAGTGTSKVYTDVERLCHEHIPRWFASEGMGAEKIAEFYADPVKQACDAHSYAKAYSLRAISIDEGWAWRAKRWARFGYRLGIGTLRQVRRRLPADAGGEAPHPLEV